VTVDSTGGEHLDHAGLARLVNMRALLFATLLLTACASTATGEEPSWGRADLKAIQRAHRSAKLENGFWVTSQGSWNVRAWGDREAAAAASVYLDRMTKTWRSAFQVSFRVDMRPTLVILPKDSYARMWGASRGRATYTWDAQGNFTKLEAHTYLTSAGPGGLDYGNLNHECSHVLLSRAVGAANVPSWLDESLATYFQAWDPLRRVKENLSRYRGVYTSQLPKQLPTLREFTLLDTPAKWDTDNMGPITMSRYAIGENFFGCLMSSKKGRKIAVALLNEVRNNGRIHPKSNAVAAAARLWPKR